MPQDKGYKDPTSTEVIHGKKVKIGTGTGERVAKKATSAISSRKARLKAALMGVNG